MQRYLAILLIFGAMGNLAAANRADVHYRTALAYHALEEFDRAVAAYQKAIAWEPNSFNAYLHLGVAYAELKQYQAALDAYHKAAQLASERAQPPETTESTPVVRNRLMQNGLRAGECHLQLSSIEFDNLVWYNIGLVYLKQGKLPLAKEAFEKAISLTPDFVDAYNGLGEVYLKQGKLAEAARVWTEAVRRNPNETIALIGLGKVYAQQRRLPLAIETFEKVIAIQADNTAAHYHLAQAFMHAGERNKAAAAMEFFKVLRQTEPLLQEAQKWVKTHPDDAKAYNNLGIVYLARRRFDKAIENYRRAIAFAPTLATAHYNLGHAYHKQRKLHLAIAAYQRAIAIDANLAIAHNNLAVCYIDFLSVARRSDRLDRELHVSLRNPKPTLSVSTFALRVEKTHLDRARLHAETAVRLAPDEQNYWDTLAQSYTLLGFPKKAQHARQKAGEP